MSATDSTAGVGSDTPGRRLPAGHGEAVPRIPVLWLALLATPVAAANNAPVLILGDMSRSLGVSTETASWLVTLSALALAVATPLMGALIRRRGTRPALWLGAALVLAGTLVVATSPWLPLTLAGRVAQAAGGAGMMAVALNLAGTVRRMGVISAGSGMLGAVGPLLGQHLTGAISWRAALSVLAVTLLAVPAVSRGARHARPPEERFDTRGAVLLAVLSGGLVLLPSNPLPAMVPAVLATILLAVHVRRRPEGSVPAVALRSPRFRGAVLVTIGLSTSYFTLLYAIPDLLGDRAGWSAGAVATGQMTAMLAGSALTLAFAAHAARMSRNAIRAVLLTAGALAALTAALAHGAVALLLAIGAAVFTATSANGIQGAEAASSVPGRERATALGLFTLVYLMGGALGPALATAMVLD
ncbi:MFS transporter [Streptomyces sp. RFCAC02]|uniref:MFS transporter n=1 Tax=Streptomyces sp. RFCAC02 TaxID=2499143 RepID=UPI001021808C|nr:MFS transporter [Streptomyces sp. RFCAC02]